MSIGFWQIAVVVILVVLLFGRGKISSLMGDVAKGIKSFKKGLSDDGAEQTQNINTDTQSSTESQSSTEAQPSKKEDSNLENK